MVIHCSGTKIRRYIKVLKYKILITFLIQLFFLIIDLPWLSGTIGIISSLYLFLLSFRFIRKKYRAFIPLMLIGIVFLGVFTRLFIFEVYNVPSESMENALFPGDNILVCKLNYGPKMPRSPYEIPWVNLLFYLTKKPESKIDSAWWEYRRLTGFGRVNRNDIIVFRYPDDESTFFVKRCIGAPTDTLQIINASVFINGKQTENASTVKQPRRLWIRKAGQFLKLSNSLGISYTIPEKTSGTVFESYLSGQELKLLQEKGCVDSVTYLANNNRGYPWNDEIDWTIDNLGPFIIPAKGTTITINARNICLYRKVLEKFEKMTISEKKGEWYFNGQVAKDYTFKQNYYFMMGDNRSESNDSRIWGLLPEEDVEGKVILSLVKSGKLVWM